MPRIRPLERNETPFTARPFLSILKKMFGKELTPYRVIARLPRILWFGGFHDLAISKSGHVEERIHELAQLRAAQMIGCPF